MEDAFTPVGEFEDPPSIEPAESASPEDGPRARPYPARVPDGEYLAVCRSIYRDRKSRTYGARIYLTFCLFGGDHNGIALRMFLRPSAWPTSQYDQAWSVANGRPPRSRNTKMSPTIFVGKLFRIRTATVKPQQRITGPDGKGRPGPKLPEPWWYSKVDVILGLEAGNGTIQ